MEPLKKQEAVALWQISLINNSVSAETTSYYFLAEVVRLAM